MVLAALAAGCFAAAAVILLRLHLLSTGLRPVGDAVSDYGTTPAHAYYRTMVVLLGAGAILLALAIGARTDARGLVWLWLYGAARIAIAGFMTDRDPPPFSAEGRIHWLLAAVAFTAIALAATTIDWPRAPGALHPLGDLVAATAIGTLATRVLAPLRPVFGLVERLLYVTSIAWLLLAAVHVAGY
jgi:hypothetical protein